ncbi:MAG: 23S rRNA (adenine(2503)-C(2))-methyltransferase RlmN [Treponema sp.]|jgi:23S rRNA (adenine2503-C2)-methyltransferase|nr:23S rRNA (adenine(2503)-C(2))-methyltransferase RlmN [Treponema sp.]
MTVPEIAAALAGLSLDEAAPRGITGERAARIRAGQIFAWIARGASSFEEMTDLPQSLRAALGETFSVRGSETRDRLEDGDGTVKLILRLADGCRIEAVALNTSGGGGYTACLSTQAGCPMGCVFCKTGALGFRRGLEPSEIVEQFLALSGAVREKRRENAGPAAISRVVVMGMGEPLLNLPALRKALAILQDPAGVGLSRRRITISTAGVYGGILEMAERGPGVELAFSLTAAREDLRRRLMPGAAAYPLDKIKEALKQYREKRGRRITLEAVLLGGINTGPEDARAFIAFAADLDAVVNLIPWNPVEGLRFEGNPLRRPRREETEAFQALLEAGGLKVTRRFRRGQGIGGACGQLG